MNKNNKLLISFTEYCLDHPEQRFWQALRNWAGVGFIYKSDVSPLDIPGGLVKDTFYEE